MSGLIAFLTNKWMAVRLTGYLLLVPAWLFAWDPAMIYSQANESYRQGKYEEAVSSYEKLAKSGHVSVDVYFNLGNAYYKSGLIPHAILNYERAKRLDPADPDIAFNLELTNAQTIDKIEAVPEVFYKKWWRAFMHGAPADGFARRGLWLLWLAVAGAAVYLFVNIGLIKRIAFFGALLVACAGLFQFYLSARQVSEMERRNEAIIFSTNVYVRSSPDEESTSLFMLHAGTKIEVLDELTGWKRIRIASGNEGWVESDALEII